VLYKLNKYIINKGKDMKAFLAQNKYKSLRDEKDLLVIASTKKEALNTIDSHIDGFQYSAFLKKDFIEVEIERFDIHSLDLIPKNLKDYGLASCFEFHISVKIKPYAPYNKILISEDDNTVKELVKMFKEENADFFKNEF
jgi:hypothetical protein